MLTNFSTELYQSLTDFLHVLSHFLIRQAIRRILEGQVISHRLLTSLNIAARIDIKEGHLGQAFDARNRNGIQDILMFDITAQEQGNITLTAGNLEISVNG